MEIGIIFVIFVSLAFPVPVTLVGMSFQKNPEKIPTLARSGFPMAVGDGGLGFLVENVGTRFNG